MPILPRPRLLCAVSLALSVLTVAASADTSVETRPPNNADARPAFAGQTRAPAMRTPVALDVRTITDALDQPWAVELLPDGRFLVTERPGRLRIVGADGRLSAPVAGLPPVFAQGQGGLLDVALDPGFAANRTIYWSYAEPRADGSGTTLAKGVLVEDARGARLEEVRILFRQQPSLRSPLHFGSRIAFGPGGRELFLTLGERGIPEGRAQAQDLGSHLGKLVRLNLDGSVPAGNPFAGRAGARPEIWSLGHRNVQGAALDADDRLWTIEHGPRGGDELNRPDPGRNYGWPVIGYGIDYSGERMHESAARVDMEQPVYYWDPVIAPGGMVFHSGRGLPDWRGNLFVAGLGSRKLVRLKLDGDRVTGEEWLLADRGLRLRDVIEGPDGALYVLAEAPAGALLRVAPAGR
ncbi:PQQ-dependent sugar dehydrogenase [Derxia gummosa]|uniref:PQQ-dependent sugar dehydrogenase n=1 Tax=Derxia gummosa DSM 723 TaxID=1121388 RepID=A0A8B6X7Q2_9BURK|nr:PQQ-dependent sugar dehydrogenase [Derxia gummosa]